MTGPEQRYDVVVVGGGAAGLSAGLMLARVRRSVLVVDAGSPRNAPAAHVHGLLGHDGIAPLDLIARGRDELARYGGQFVAGTVARLGQTSDGFEVQVGDGRTARARRLLLAAGLSDVLPAIPGLRERWGRDVLFCPYCHGWEARDAAIGVVHTGPLSVKQALLWRTLSDDVVYLAAGPALDAADSEVLTASGIAIEMGVVDEVLIADDGIVGVLVNGRTMTRSVLSVVPRVVLDEDLMAGVGLEADDHPSGVGRYLPVDATGRTATPGVWAAGNLADPTAHVGTAAASAAVAVIDLNADLVAEDAASAVAQYRAGSGSPGGRG
jgi:thioredoxin reductase